MSLRLAMLTPSSNIVVETVCTQINGALPDCSMHFGRVEVLHIDDDDTTNAQFQDARMLEACTLLSHVRPDVIAWNGTAAAWLGAPRDRRLIEMVEAKTGCRMVTSTLSILDALHCLGAKRIGLVTPYVIGMQSRIIETLAEEGLTCAAERHFDITDNFAFGEVSEAAVAEAARGVAIDGAEAIVILCTNLAGAGIAAKVEQETGIPVLDSVTLTVWGCLRACDQVTAPLAPWGPRIAALP